MSWTQRASYASYWPVWLRSDGTDLYYVAHYSGQPRDVYHFDCGTYANTKILDSTTFSNWVGTLGIAVHGGSLYALICTVPGGSPFYRVVEVYKHAGGGVWNSVDTVLATGISTGVGGWHLSSDGTYLVAAVTSVTPAAGEYSRYSTDGASWSSATWQTYSGFSYMNYSTGPGTDAGSRCPADWFDYPYQIFSSGGWPPTNLYPYYFDGSAGQWLLAYPGSRSAEYFQSTPNYEHHWVATTFGDYTDDAWVSTTTPSSTNPRPMHWINMPWQPGLYTTGLYKWTGTDWTSYDAGLPRSFTNTEFPYLARQSDSIPWLMAKSGSTWYIYESTVAIPDQVAKFYEGQNTLTLRATLDYREVEPDGMLALDNQSLRPVYIGFNEDTDTDANIIEADNADTYASFGDYDTGVTASEEIKAIKQV